MAQYLFLYRGPSYDPSTVSPEDGAAVMGKWLAWMGGIGEHLTDGGNPVIAHANVTPGGTGSTTDVNGYSFVEAPDLKTARSYLKGHPHLLDPQNSVDVLEVTPLPRPD